MVFGWGKRREPAVQEPVPTTREISFGDIDAILGDLKGVRARALVSEAAEFRKRASYHLSEIHKIAIRLEGDDLNTEDIDKHLKTIVERGKKQVIAAIKEEASGHIPEVSGIDDALMLNTRIGRSLKRVGDVLGRQSRVIHLFAKKYAGKLKIILAELRDGRDALQALIDNYKDLESGILEIRQGTDTIRRSRETLEKRAERIRVFEGSLADLKVRSEEINREIEKITGSPEYVEYQRVRAELDGLEPDRRALKRGINDQFTKISRPLGKYEYVSSMDKEQKALLHALASDPFQALSDDKKDEIVAILESVRRGVLSGSVSVKDTEKSAQSIDETVGLLDSLIRQKAEFASREAELRGRLDSFDTGTYRARQSELEKTARDCEDAESKIRGFRSEIAETERLIPKLTAEIEQKLQDLSHTTYIIAEER